MNRMTGAFVAMLACALLAVVVFYATDSISGKSFASPQDVVEAMRQAGKKDDLRAWCQCLTDDSRDLLAARVIVDDFTKKQDKEKNGTDKEKAYFRAVAGVVTQHGLTDEFLGKLQREMITVTHPKAPIQAKVSAAQSILAPIKDRDAFIEELFNTIQKLTGSPSPLAMWKNAKLTDVQITGNTAEGKVNLGQGAIENFTFRRQGNGWRLELFAEEEQPPEMPPGHPPVGGGR